MSANAMLNDYRTLQLQDEEITNIKMDHEKILNLTTISLKMYSTSYYKESAFLELSDIDQIKSALTNYLNKDEKIAEFKNELIGDLTDFQKKINTNHVQKLFALAKQKQEIEKQIKALDAEKRKLMSKLPKFFWSYDKTIKEYDNKIAALNVQVQKCVQKISSLEQARPSANEKDILLYQMSLKEKYTQKY